MAAQLTSTKGPSARALVRWMARARTPLPVPVSPWIRIGGKRWESPWRSRSRPIWVRMATIPGLSPTRSPRGRIAVGIVPPGLLWLNRPKGVRGTRLGDQPNRGGTRPAPAVSGGLVVVVEPPRDACRPEGSAAQVPATTAGPALALWLLSVRA